MKEIPIAGGDTAKPLTLRKRVAKVIGELSGVAKGRFLDCGCGAGDYVEEFGRQGWQAFGVEYLEEKIQQARLRGIGSEILSQGDLQNLDYEDRSFDVALFNEVLEHVPDDDLALEEAFRILKPGGHLFVFSPNRFYPFESHGVYAKGRGKKLPVWIPFIPWLPVSIGGIFFRYWARNYWPSELQAKVRKAGFQITNTSYTWQTFEGISGSQAVLIRVFRPLLRAVSGIFEKTPILRKFGVSQFIHAVKQ